MSKHLTSSSGTFHSVLIEPDGCSVPPSRHALPAHPPVHPSQSRAPFCPVFPLLIFLPMSLFTPHEAGTLQPFFQNPGRSRSPSVDVHVVGIVLLAPIGNCRIFAPMRLSRMLSISSFWDSHVFSPLLAEHEMISEFLGKHSLESRQLQVSSDPQLLSIVAQSP